MTAQLFLAKQYTLHKKTLYGANSVVYSTAWRPGVTTMLTYTSIHIHHSLFTVFVLGETEHSICFLFLLRCMSAVRHCVCDHWLRGVLFFALDRLWRRRFSPWTARYPAAFWTSRGLAHRGVVKKLVLFVFVFNFIFILLLAWVPLSLPNVPSWFFLKHFLNVQLLMLTCGQTALRHAWKRICRKVVANLVHCALPFVDELCSAASNYTYMVCMP